MNEEASKITVVIADDHAMVRSGLRALLEREQDIEVVDEAGDVETALRKVRAHRPDVLLLDLIMPGAPVIESIPSIDEVNADTNIVVLTMQSDPAYAKTALQAGASGYVLKDAVDADLVGAVRQVAQGGTYLDPKLGARLARSDGTARSELLSKRETEVLSLIALGHTNQEISEKLFLSVRTVESHRSHIQQKLRLSTRAELVRYALDSGLVPTNSNDGS